MSQSSNMPIGPYKTGREVPAAFGMHARLVSYIFHPLFIPLYVAAFLLYIHPVLFTGISAAARMRLLATVFVNLTLLPGVTVLLCWRLRFVGSLHLYTQKERIIPLAAAMIFYFWCWYVLRSFPEVPFLFKQFLLGGFIAVIGGWMANIYFKISLHALAAGGMAGFVFLAVCLSDGGSALYPAYALLTAGMVCSARLMLGAHRPFEVYAGFMAGVASQLLAMWLV